ncbi:hypothetical protein G6F70_009250 [Rhizopus microsporus]|nr:hypothetical protein G6F70_009250 [Rhizopus microsporus]
MRWNLNEEFGHPDNQLVFDELLTAVTLARGTQRLPQEEANKKRYTRVSQSVGGGEASKSKLRSRKARKLKGRREAFVRHRDAFPNEEYPGASAFFEMAYVSDEEDGQINPDTGKVMSFKVLTPSWRSQKLNDFFVELDRLRFQRSNALGHLERVAEPVAVELPQQAVESLPRWGLKQYE